MRPVLALLAGTLIVAVVALSAYLARGPSPSAKVSLAPVATSGETSDAYKELAEHLLSYPIPGPDGQVTTTRLVPGGLPAELAFDLPMLPGARLIGSALRLRGDKPVAVTAVMDVPAKTEEVLGQLEREYDALGWKLLQRSGLVPGGFVPSVAAAPKMFCKGEGAPSIVVQAFADPDGTSDVRVSYEAGTNLPQGAFGPCAQKNVVTPAQVPQTRLPVLRPPDGVTLQPSGTSMGGNRQSSEATATTSKPSDELEANFAQQLRAAGWTRVGGRADAAIAWSTWKLPGEGEWVGLLLVADLSLKDRRMLLLHAESATLGLSGGTFTTSSELITVPGR